MRDVTDWESWSRDPDNIYCGRPHALLGDNGFGNDYRVATYGRQRAVELYKANTLPSITGTQLVVLSSRRVFGCWCHQDEVCHTDLLIKLL